MRMWKNAYQGIHVKEFILFYNENIQYYITEEEEHGQIAVTESVNVQLDHNMKLEEDTRYNQLNFMLTALDVQDDKTLMETGIIFIKPEREVVDQLIETSLEEILPKAVAKNIALNRSHFNGTACFDRKWTAEALFNILDNAVKYTPEGGSITIAATAYEMFYRIDIADNGIGIAEEELNKVFCRFYRSPEVNQGEGVGIGLYLAREIISAQGGYIKVKSSKGSGSVFSVFLPIDQ